MKIEIEISEETAACIWANELGEKTGLSVAFYVKNLVESEADQYRKMFPDDVAAAVLRFRGMPCVCAQKVQTFVSPGKPTICAPHEHTTTRIPLSLGITDLFAWWASLTSAQGASSHGVVVSTLPCLTWTLQTPRPGCRGEQS